MAFYPPVIFPESHGSLGDQLKECGRCPLSSSALLLPRCRMWWFLSPGTTCWRWDWAELLLFAPLAPGFHGSLFLTLQEWRDVIYRCKVMSRSFYRKIWDGHIYWEERGGLSEGTCPIPESTPIFKVSSALQASLVHSHSLLFFTFLLFLFRCSCFAFFFFLTANL